MDFELGSDIDDLRALCAEILTDNVTRERLGEVEREGGIDLVTYRLLGRSGVLGAAVPLGGEPADIGLVGLCQVLEEVGRHTAQVPVWESIVLGALTVAEHGSAAQRELLGGVCDGSVLLTAALVEPDGADPRAPRTVAAEAGGGWLLSGVKTQVPLAASAERILVSASVGEGRTGVFLVDTAGDGVVVEAQESVAMRPLARVTLSDAPGEPVGAFDGVLDGLLLRARVGLAALQVGNASAALRLTADRATQREQFGRPIATFQAVSQRLADAYTDVEAMRLSTLQAAWALEAGRPTAETERAVAIAKYWAADGGHRVLSTAQHVHGGIGIDLDHGLHRHFRLGKYVEFTLGSAGDQLRALGRRHAEQD